MLRSQMRDILHAALILIEATIGAPSIRPAHQLLIRCDPK
jgi:hypothetical protein